VNVFADPPGLLDISGAESSANPYAPPVDRRKGRYDHSLAKRIFYAVAAIAGVYLLASAVASWQVWSCSPQSDHNQSIIKQIGAFLLDWDQLKRNPSYPDTAHGACRPIGTGRSRLRHCTPLRS